MSKNALAQTEEEISAFERVEEELREFSYIVSHDLAASFRHLSQFSRLLVNEIRGGMTDNQRLYAAQIDRAALRCQTMMERLLTFSRVQQKYLTVASNDAVRLIEGVLMQLSEQRAKINPSIEIAPLGNIRVDGELMTIALKEVLDNALKFGRKDLPLTVKVDAAVEGDQWHLRVTDDGIGIPPEHYDKAFRMFAQLHPEGTYPGVGAGLAICQRIIRRHGGEMQFLYNKSGTTIELSLPASVVVNP